MQISHINALTKINSILRGTHIPWAVIGSTNMALQGMNITPQDIDIIIPYNDVWVMPTLFSQYAPTPVTPIHTPGYSPAFEVKIHIDHINVQIIAEKSTGEYGHILAEQRIIYINTANCTLPCFTLQAESLTYSQTGRKNKANMINEYLRMLNNNL